ncbi:MAG: GAF domain-containing protein, partial [Deltaproteobacteria bacterium]|nr:GAF domain-containing protein [Deltaproteobacteria bacterium]
MDTEEKRAEGLELQVKRLASEVERLRERELELEETRRAMLYILEDLNESNTGIAHAKAEWESIFDSIADPIFIHDRDFHVTRCNRAYMKYAGLAFNEIIGSVYHEVFPIMKGPFKACVNCVERAASVKDKKEEEEEVAVPPVNKTFKVRSYPLKAGGSMNSLFIHIMEDITESKKAEEKIGSETELNRRLLMIADATAQTTDIERLLEHVVECVGRVMGCDVCLAYTIDSRSGKLRPRRASGLARDMVPFFRVESLEVNIPSIEKAFNKREPVLERLSSGRPSIGGEDSRGPAGLPFEWVEGGEACVMIPLMGRENPLGVLACIYTQETGRFSGGITERDRQVIRGISSQVSTAIEEARLFKDSIDKTMELSRKVETIQAMHEIDVGILSMTEPQEILETAVRMTGKVIPCDRATIALVDEERKGFNYAAGFGIGGIKKGSFIDFRDTNATDMLKTRRPQFIANLRGIKDPPHLEKMLMEEGFLSHLRVPVIIKGEVAGILSVGAKRQAAYAPEDLSIIEKLASQIGVALENSRLVEDLEGLFIGVVRTLSAAIDAKSPWTRGHSDRVTRIALSIGQGLGFAAGELKTLELAGLLHDIGKLATYEAILDKPGRLTPEESRVIRLHPKKGAEILAPIKQMKDIVPAIRHHHESYDGTGYPDGLKGDGIPLLARILAVADTIDAMGADRPYRKGKSMDEIVSELH